jgi:type I restriction enzyme S subunit
LKRGDVLMTEGGDLDKLGRGAVWNDEIASCLHQNHVFAVRPDQRQLMPEYLALITQSSYARAYFERTGTKTTNLASTSSSKIRDFRVPLIDLDEQRRIVDFLDAEAARIDALIEMKRRTIALLEERVQAFVNEVTPGAMVRGPDGRPVGIAGMECVRLGAIAAIHGGFTMDAGRDNGGDTVTLPYLRVANVQDGSLALDDIKEVTLPRELAKRCTLRPGDVLMTEGGDPDKLGRGTVWPGNVEPCLHQNAIFAVRPDSRLLPEYLALVTRTRYARAYFEMTASKSTGIAHTSSTKITGFRVPMRAVAEQSRVVRQVQEALARIEELRAPTERQVNLLAERRQALITAAVTGAITV